MAVGSPAGQLKIPEDGRAISDEDERILGSFLQSSHTGTIVIGRRSLHYCTSITFSEEGALQGQMICTLL